MGAVDRQPRIMAAPNGARLAKRDHPNLPITIDEIAEEALACQLAGADALHLHVRDKSGGHSLDPGHYTDAIAAVTEWAPGMDIQITTEAAGRYSVKEQSAVLRLLAPKAASVAVREMHRDAKEARGLYYAARDIGTSLQHILYDKSDLDRLIGFQRDAIIPDGPLSVLLVFGSYMPPSPARTNSVLAAVRALPSTISDWTACAFGPEEQNVLIEASRHGGDVRIGFENNRVAPDGTPAENTAANIAAFRMAWAGQQNTTFMDKAG